jgi:hypothetical protein
MRNNTFFRHPSFSKMFYCDSITGKVITIFNRKMIEIQLLSESPNNIRRYDEILTIVFDNFDDDLLLNFEEEALDILKDILLGHVVKVTVKSANSNPNMLTGRVELLRNYKCCMPARFAEGSRFTVHH